MSAGDFHRQRVSALPILLFAGIDLVIALVLLLGNGFTVGFWAILAIGIVLAVLGFLRLYSKPPE